MRQTIAFHYQGASGERFTFVLIDLRNAHLLPRQGGIFVFSEFGPHPLYIGEGPSLFGAITKCRQGLVAKRPCALQCAQIFIENNPGRRATIAADMIARYSPPWNMETARPPAEWGRQISAQL